MTQLLPFFTTTQIRLNYDYLYCLLLGYINTEDSKTVLIPKSLLQLLGPKTKEFVKKKTTNEKHKMVIGWLGQIYTSCF